MFGYGSDPAAIKAKRYRNASRLFKRNELQRASFDQLRLNSTGIDTTTHFTKRSVRRSGIAAPPLLGREREPLLRGYGLSAAGVPWCRPAIAP